MLNLDLNRGGAVTADQLKNVQAQIDRLRDLPAMREQAAAAEAAETTRRAELIDELSALEILAEAQAGGYGQDLQETAAEVERCRAALRQSEQRHNEAEIARATADQGFRRKQAKLENELNGLGELEVEELLTSLARENLACQNAQAVREERKVVDADFEPKLRFSYHSVTPAMDAHVKKLASLQREANSLRRAKLPVATVRERASELRKAAMIGAAIYFTKNGAMPKTPEDAAARSMLGRDMTEIKEARYVAPWRR